MATIEKNINDISWKLIKNYFKNNTLIDHHLDGYNDFFSNGIYQIVNEMNPIKIRKNYDEKKELHKFECDIYIGGLEGKNIYSGKPIIYDENHSHMMYPNEARLRNMTYGTTMYYDVVIEFKTYSSKENDYIKETLDLKKILLGKLPIMVQSNLCILKNLDREQRFHYGECKNDYGGYFIIDGKEKCIVPQEKFSNNMLYIKKNIKDGESNDDVDDKYLYSAVIKTESEDPSKPVRTLKMHIVAPNDKNTNLNIVVEVPNVRKPIPFFILMRALGCKSDKEIISYCLFDLDKNSSFLEDFIPSIHDAGIIFSQEQAQKYISAFTKGKTKYHILEILMNYLLPQIGELNFKNKAYFLGNMCFQLLKVYKNINKPTDRDNFSYKRVEVTGTLVYDLFKEYYNLQKKDIFMIIDKDINYNYKNKIDMETVNMKDVFEENYVSYFKNKIVEKGFKKAFKGNWGATPHTKKVGVLQDLNRLSYLSSLSHLRKISLPLDESAKVVGPRLLHNSQWGIIDPVDTPDGGNCGLHKHMTILSNITKGYSGSSMTKWLRHYMNLILLEETNPDFMYNFTKIFVNGSLIGFLDKLLETVNIIKNYRRLGVLPAYTSISFNISENSIFIFTDGGRLCRPLYYVNNDKLSINKNNIDLLKDATWNNIVCGFHSETNFNFKDNKFYKLDFLYNSKEYEDLKSMIDFVDTSESDSALIASNISQLKGEKKYSHLEIHPSLLLGVMGNHVIFPEHNQLPRNLFSCGQSKQACSLFHSNFKNRVDKSGIVLNYGETPLVKSKYLDLINNEEHAYGNNTIVAIMAYSGYNVEDAILVNEGSIKRGLFNTTYFNTYESYEESSQTASSEVDSVFSDNKDNNVLGKKIGFDYSKLNEVGLIEEETPVTDKTIIIGKKTFIEDNDTFSDSSSTPKKGQLGIVDKTFITDGEEGFRLAKVRIREHRIPNLGDKMASRAGQKGTVGLVIPEENMPFCENGLKPDLIINPHAIPSRMTIGQLLECILGKIGCIEGYFGDCTAYNTSSDKLNIYSKILQKHKYNSHGNEILYNGMTGEQIESEIFIGPTYYMRLKHMTKDKINYRAKGPTMSLTNQPVKGRANDGGLRIGEMERDGVIGHGASLFLKESMMERGDKYHMAICNQTGTIAAYNNTKNIFISPFADGPIKWKGSVDNVKISNITRHGRSFSIVKVPYCFKLLIQELQTMNVLVRVITEDNIDQIVNLNKYDNHKQLTFDNEKSLEQHLLQVSSQLNRYPTTNINKYYINMDKENANTPEELPRISPLSPPYAPGSPAYAPGTTPPYAPGSPDYAPGTTPPYAPGSPDYAPGMSPPYAPGSPYVPGTSPEYGPPGSSPPYAPGSSYDTNSTNSSGTPPPPPPPGAYSDSSSGSQPFSHHVPNNLNETDDDNKRFEESALKFRGENARSDFYKYYRNKFPDASEVEMENAYSTFLDSGEIIDNNDVLEPEDFVKKDKPKIKTDFIDHTKENKDFLDDDIQDVDIEDDNDNIEAKPLKKVQVKEGKLDDNEDNSDDEDDNKSGGDGGKFTLKKIIL